MKEKLEEKIKLLSMEREQILANLNANAGAIQICNRLLEELTKEEETVKTLVDNA